MLFVTLTRSPNSYSGDVRSLAPARLGKTSNSGALSDFIISSASGDTTKVLSGIVGRLVPLAPDFSDKIDIVSVSLFDIANVKI